MGIDITVHLGVSHDLTQERLTDELNEGCPNVKRLVTDWVYPNVQRPSTPSAIRWNIPPDWRGSGELFSLYIPHGNCILSIWRQRAEFFHGFKWRCIWLYPEFQHLLRWACFDLAQLLGSKEVIYTPEVIPVMGKTLDEVTQNLRRDRGNPAPTLDSLQYAEEPDLYTAMGCYFIDTFADLSPH